MHDVAEPTEGRPIEGEHAKPDRDRASKARWAAAGMGIGSAALVAALLYANRTKAPKRPQ